MKRVLIFSDSLGLPRNFPETVLYEDTWPVLLKKDGLIIHQVSIGGATSSDILGQVFYHKMFNPDLIILQFGIVDCAPRFASKIEINILRRIPIIGKFLLSLLNKPLVRKYRNIKYVNPSRFILNLKKIVDEFKGKDIYFLGVLPATKEYEKILPNVTENSRYYNDIVKNNPNISFINLGDIPNVGIMSDGHHLSKEGHEFVYNQLKPVFNV